MRYNQGDTAAAADIWEKDWRNAPDVGRWAAWIADARLASKDYKRAADFLEKSLQFDPNNAVQNSWCPNSSSCSVRMGRLPLSLLPGYN